MGKILQLTFSLECGGIQAFVTNLNGCRDVFAEPFDFLLYGAGSEEEHYERANREYGSGIYKVGDDTSHLFLIRCIQKRWRVYCFLKNHDYDVVHIHNPAAFCMIEAALAKMAGVPKVVVHAHNTVLSGSGASRACKKAFGIAMKPFWRFFADVCCACSAEAGIYMFGKKAVRAGKVHILKNGILAQKYSFAPHIREAYRRAHGLEGRFVVGHVGRFVKQKNHEFLITVFAELVRLEPDAALLLFGEGELKPQIVRQVRKLGLKEKVFFCGISTEIAEWMQAMDVFVLPSLYEGLPVAGVEAQAAGLPVVASDTVTRELKLLDTTEFLPLNAGPAAWAEHILRCRGDQRKNTIEAIRKAGYDIQTTAQILKGLYFG